MNKMKNNTSILNAPINNVFNEDSFLRASGQEHFRLDSALIHIKFSSLVLTDLSSVFVTISWTSAVHSFLSACLFPTSSLLS